MRRLLTLAIAAGLAAPIGAAADSAKPSTATDSQQVTKPMLTAEQADRLPAFLREPFERAGIAEPSQLHPWIASWMRAIGFDIPTPPTPPTPPSPTATASR